MNPKKNIKVPEATHAALKSVMRPCEKIEGITDQFILRGVKSRKAKAKKGTQ